LKVVEQRLIERMEELEATTERQNGRKGSGAYG
jgi:hypothetical protein